MNLPLPLRVLNTLGILLFAAASWLQANDIDPQVYYHASSLDAALWLLFYALIAILFGVALCKPIPVWILLAAALACLVELLRTGPGLWTNLFGGQSFTMVQKSMSAADPRVELTREFFGALLALAAGGVLWWERVKFARR
jgi:glucan phosphoethanolaminetransferase (alkaline phosphatase superfamily)